MIKVANGYVEIGDRIYSNNLFEDMKEPSKIDCDDDNAKFSVIVTGIDFNKSLLRYHFECNNTDILNPIIEVRPDEEQPADGFYIKRETQIKNIKKSIKSLLNGKNIIKSKEVINNIIYHLKH